MITTIRYILKISRSFPRNGSKQLLSIILDMNLDKRNRLIFSCVSASQTALPSAAREFVNLLSCMTIHLPPLRERMEELPTISSLYLGNLNVELARQIIGFEPEAMPCWRHMTGRITTPSSSGSSMNWQSLPPHRI